METVLSRKNEKIVYLKKLASSAALRRETGETVCDGAKLLREAVLHGVEIKTVLFCTEDIPHAPGAELIKTTKDIIESVSVMKTAQTVLFSCVSPKTYSISDIGEKAVILENIQDPGNVGTMLRTANAFGISSVILLGECADPFAPKTVRASMGASFRQQIIRASLDDIRTLTASGRRIYGASLSARSELIDEVELTNTVVAIGNEGSGLTPELLSLCAGELIIPMESDCESLNAAAAAAVTMWEMRKRG